MGNGFKEVAHLRTDKEKFDEGWDRIFGAKKEQVSKVAPVEQAESVEEKFFRRHDSEQLFAKFGITRAWVNEQYEIYSGDDKEDVNWRTERSGWEFIAEAVLRKVVDTIREEGFPESSHYDVESRKHFRLGLREETLSEGHIESLHDEFVEVLGKIEKFVC